MDRAALVMGVGPPIIVARDKVTPQGCPNSPRLANLFMHYAFDKWMGREFPGCPFGRFADDIVLHSSRARSRMTAISAGEAAN